MQCSSEASRCGPKWQFSIWTNRLESWIGQQIALSADMEAMFGHVFVPSDDNRCLQFLWREDQEQRIELYEYTRHVFGAKSLLTGANYSLHQVAKINGQNIKNFVKAVQQKIYMEYSLKSVRTTQEATEIYQKNSNLLSKGGLILMKRITSAEVVKSPIPEADRSMNVVKNFEAEPQSSSILEMNWNVDTDSLIVCRATEQEVSVKISR